MATGQPGLSTPRPKSGKPVGPTNGRMYPGVRYWWLVVRANLRRADSRSRYTYLSHRWNCFVCIANPEQERIRRPRDLPTYNSQFSRNICIFEPQNPGTGNIFMRFTHETVHAVLFLVPFLAWSTFALFFVQKTHRFASLSSDFICIRTEFEIQNKIFLNF